MKRCRRDACATAGQDAGGTRVRKMSAIHAGQGTASWKVWLDWRVRPHLITAAPARKASVTVGLSARDTQTPEENVTGLTGFSGLSCVSCHPVQVFVSFPPRFPPITEGLYPPVIPRSRAVVAQASRLHATGPQVLGWHGHLAHDPTGETPVPLLRVPHCGTNGPSCFRCGRLRQ
jgi:hypothetical protein